MSQRTKCPACGRRQSLHEGDAGQMVYCSACGTRFLADAITPETEKTEIATIAPQSEPAMVFTSPILLPVEETVQPQPMHVAPPPATLAPSAKWLMPLAMILVLLTAAAIVGGVYAFSSWFNRYPTQSATASTPTTLPALLPATKVAVDSTNEEPSPATELTSEKVVAPVPSQPIAAAPSISKPVPPIDTEITAQKFHPVRPTENAGPDLDDEIGRSIGHGVDFLLSQFSDGRLKSYKKTDGESAGMDALAVYALLHAAEATHDLRLGATTTLVGQMLDALKAMPMEHDDATYSRSLRAAALGVYHRAQDQQALRADAVWLMKESMNGAFYYGPADPALQRVPLRLGRFRPPVFLSPWDNSNSQYGALGVWAAMDAGVDIPNSFWTAVQQHWLSCQLPDGEWAYGGYGDMGRLSMTVAGITTLLVAEDQLDAKSVVNLLGHPPFTPALAHALTWLEAGDNSVTLPETWRTYNLFGLERAALASGFKYFGTHNWYSELAPEQIKLQETDGSWTGYAPVVDTSYTLLFLSRGRHPIFMNKLRFDGFWSNRPRDISNLTHYADAVLERPMNWQVVSLKTDWSDWMDSPVLYIASHEALDFSDADCDKLRSFAENGGLIFTHADGDNGAFNRSIVELSHRLFPQYTLNDLPPEHPIYSILYRIKPAIRLQAVSNGSRLLLLNSPTDLNRSWQQRDSTGRPAAFQMGVNIFIYAAGKADLRNKLTTPMVAEPQVAPILTTTVAQLRHLGDWDPEPAGLPRFARMFLGQTSVKVNVVDADPAELDAGKISLAHLTGTGPVHFLPAEIKSVRDYVDNGGILLIDACGASADFNQSMQLDFFPHAFPKSLFADMPKDDPILAGTGDGMIPVNLRLRPYRSEIDGTTTQPIQYFTQGKGMVIFSPIDLSTAMLGTNTWAINGYQPETAYNLIHNVLLSALER